MSVFVETMMEKLYLKFIIYVFVSAFIAESVQSLTDPGRELHEYPVMPGKNWLLCNPLLSLIQQDNVNVSGGWSIWQRDEWSWIGGIRQPSIGNTTDTWEYQFSNRYTRYGFYGSHFLFLQIKNVTKEDNGSIYRCRITQDGHPKPVYFKLHVMDPEEVPPSLTNFSPDQVAVEGDPASVILYCNANGKPTPNITWTKVYDNNSDSDVLFTGEQFVLNNNCRNNAGTYRCKADNGIGSAVNQKIHVTVNFKPENVVLIVNDSNIPLCVGVVISLSCSAVGDPVVSYRLFENDVLVSNSSSPIVWSKLASTEGVLVYRCVAYNTVGTSNTTASVTVNGNPSHSDGETCTIWKVLTAILVVALSFSIIIYCWSRPYCQNYCQNYFMNYFMNIYRTVCPQLEMNHDEPDGSPTFDGLTRNIKNEDVGHDADGEQQIPLSVQENNDSTAILPGHSYSLEEI